MKQKLINDVVQGMLPFLNNAQAERLQDVLQHALWRYEVCETTGGEPEQEQDLVALFLSAKRIEGCSEKSLKYYQSTIQAMLLLLIRLERISQNIKSSKRVNSHIFPTLHAGAIK